MRMHIDDLEFFAAMNNREPFNSAYDKAVLIASRNEVPIIEWHDDGLITVAASKTGVVPVLPKRRTKPRTRRTKKDKKNKK